MSPAVVDLLSEVRRGGVTLTPDGPEGLVMNGPRELMTMLTPALRTHKAAVLEALAAGVAAAEPRAPTPDEHARIERLVAFVQAEADRPSMLAWALRADPDIALLYLRSLAAEVRRRGVLELLASRPGARRAVGVPGDDGGGRVERAPSAELERVARAQASQGKAPEGSPR